jgi:hypothetical protein
MTSHSNIRSDWTCIGFAAVLALMAFAMPARAAEPAPVFPTGSRLGLVPPPGMVPSMAFNGFVDPDKNAGIVITALPAEAYASMAQSMNDEALKKQGITIEKHETMQLSIGRGDLVEGTQLSPDKKLFHKWLLLVPANNITAAVTVQVPDGDKAYSDSVVRAALASLTVRTTIPDSEYLRLLPFTIGDLAGFHIVNLIPGRAALLIDAPEYPHMVATDGLPTYEFNARCIITAAPGAPTEPDARTHLAQIAFNNIEGIKDIHITMGEPVRLDGQEGFETVASAKDANSGAKLMVIQWLRFEGGDLLELTGIARAEIWDQELSRLRAIRAGVAFRQSSPQPLPN